MATKISKTAAKRAGDIFDNAANLAVRLAKLGHLDDTIAEKYAYQCDLISDHVAKLAGVNVSKLALTGDDVFDEGTLGFDPEEIGEEVAGPLEKEPDEPYMNGEFSQQEFRELRETVENEESGPTKTKDDQQTPRPGVQASSDLVREIGLVLASATRCSSSPDAKVRQLGQTLDGVGRTLLAFHLDSEKGNVAPNRVKQISAATVTLTGNFDKINPTTAPKLVKMASTLRNLAE